MGKYYDSEQSKWVPKYCLNLNLLSCKCFRKPFSCEIVPMVRPLCVFTESMWASYLQFFFGHPHHFPNQLLWICHVFDNMMTECFSKCFITKRQMQPVGMDEVRNLPNIYMNECSLVYFDVVESSIVDINLGSWSCTIQTLIATTPS